MFHSILFKDESSKELISDEPAFFRDLNLDQIIDLITSGRQEYNLKPFFYTTLNDIDEIYYRHEVMQDLENPELFKRLKSFTEKMRVMREHVAKMDKLYYHRQKQRWFLDVVDIYCGAIDDLSQDLSKVDLKSRGLLAFREYLMTYAGSDHFKLLHNETKKIIADLSTIQYCLLIRESSITVQKFERGDDYSAEVEKTFAKFKQGAVKDYRVSFSDYPDMNHIEARILDFVAELYPEIFLGLDQFYSSHHDYLDEVIGVFDREIQFYIAYLEYIAIFKRVGLKFCYPTILTTSREVLDYEGFDLALTHKLIVEGSSVVCNDFYLKNKERIFVITGPNQGGKTTFARSFGQLHYLASIGCLVPGREAQLYLYDKLFTHFEKEENVINFRGKLQDDLIRIHDILRQATSSSIIIMNEIFTSTTLKDAIYLSREILERIIDLDLLCVCVTFIDELASMSEKTVSMVSTVVPENPELRTFRIERKLADGLSYAISIAEKHGLTFERLRERIKS